MILKTTSDNGKAFLVQLLDYFVAVPVAVFYLSQFDQWDDVLLRLKTVLMYLFSCNKCLRLAKTTGRPPKCKFFCKECFKSESVRLRHTKIFEDWNCDCRPCETCMESIPQGYNIECERYHILSSISDQDSAYEKVGKHISEALANYLENDTEFLFSFYHIHDIDHQVKQRVLDILFLVIHTYKTPSL